MEEGETDPGLEYVQNLQKEMSIPVDWPWAPTWEVHV